MRVDPGARFYDAAAAHIADRGTGEPELSDTASPPLEEAATQTPAVPEGAEAPAATDGAPPTDAPAATDAPARSHAAPTSGDCLNCGAPLRGSFCAICGQKSVKPNPTFHDLWHEFIHEMLHVDGRLFQSIKLLFMRPGFLTREYCQGRRARYLAPLRLYLIFSVLYFAVQAYWPPPTTVHQNAKLGQVVNAGGINVSGERLLKKMTPEQVAERVQHAQNDWVPRLMFVLVPVWALLVMAVTRRARRNFPEHLCFSLHVHAAFFGALLFAHLLRLLHLPWLSSWITAWDVLFVLVYTALAIHAVYGGTWVRAALRTGVVSVIYFSILIVATLTVVGVVLLR